MNFKAEYIERLAQRRRMQLGSLSDEAYVELHAAVAKNPEEYLDNAEDKAFKYLGDILAKEDELRADDEFLDDTDFEKARKKHLDRLRAGCEQALEISDTCIDARSILAMSANDDSHYICRAISATWAVCAKQRLGELEAAAPLSIEPGLAVAQDLELDERCLASLAQEPKVFARPYLRLLANRARWELNTTRYSSACNTCKLLADHSHDDAQGARFTWAIALARLEDEEAFNALDARFAHQGNAWSHLARAVLMFKLDRTSAAKRALRSYDSLCKGGAYALLRPVYVDSYLPDRPTFEPGSFEEAVLAVHECDPVVMDTPDFLPWCQTQQEFLASAQTFARNNDLDW